MAVESITVPLGSKLPAFALKDPAGKLHKSSELSGQNGLLIIFTCNHCPYAIAVWPRIITLSHEIAARGVHTIAINPNIHPDFPADAPDKMRDKINELLINFPYLVDETQEVAREFKAQCTPDIYLYNGAGELAYHGRLDDSWQDPAKVTRRELAAAVENMLAGNPPLATQYPSMGCSIKWK